MKRSLASKVHPAAAKKLAETIQPDDSAASRVGKRKHVEMRKERINLRMHTTMIERLKSLAHSSMMDLNDYVVELCRQRVLTDENRNSSLAVPVYATQRMQPPTDNTPPSAVRPTASSQPVSAGGAP